MTSREREQPRLDAAFVTIAKRRGGSRGSRLDLPDDVGFLELARPIESNEAEFALYEISTSDLPRCAAARAVPPSVADLLCRAEEHPPAMALMRDAVVHRAVSPPSPDLFLRRVEWLIKRYLRPDVRARQFAARCLVDQCGYRSAGQIYWLVAYSPSEMTVSWVSADYWVYTDPARVFEASAEALASLPGAPPLYWPDDADDFPPA